jgi:hypothetical protein
MTKQNRILHLTADGGLEAIKFYDGVLGAEAADTMMGQGGRPLGMQALLKKKHHSGSNHNAAAPSRI